MKDTLVCREKSKDIFTFKYEDIIYAPVSLDFKERLRMELHLSIQIEDFEYACILRDKIKE